MVVQPVCSTSRKVNGKTQLPQELLPELVVMGLSGDVVVVVGEDVVPEPDPPSELDSHVQGSGALVDGAQVFISGIWESIQSRK